MCVYKLLFAKKTLLKIISTMMIIVMYEGPTFWKYNLLAINQFYI
jgi:hypothetical protein